MKNFDERFSLISMGIQSSSKQTGQAKIRSQKRHISDHSFNEPFYWEHIIREFVFRTISPPPTGNYHLYRRVLEAPFYNGPFPIAPSDATNVVLSRGDVYHLPSGHWLFCQQGCTECGLCNDHTHATVKWVLRRIKRISSHGGTRHDLQVTIVPQIDGSYHMRSLWPQSYVYVTSQGEQDIYLNDKHNYRNDASAYATVENDSSGEQKKIKQFWIYADKNSLPEKRIVVETSDNRGDHVSTKRVPENVTRGQSVESTSPMPRKEDEERIDLKNVKRQRSETMQPSSNGSSTDVRSKETGGRTKQLIPRLILGTDQMGQKHLVHVVPADATANTSLINSVMSNVLNSSGQNRTAYQRILRRILDSLNNNRRSIERFLELPMMSTEKSNQHQNEHQEQETRSNLPGLQGQANHPYTIHNNRNESSFQKRWPYTLNWNKQRRMSNNDTFVNNFINNTHNIGHNFNNTYILFPKVQNNDAVNKTASNNLPSKLIEENNYKNNTIHRNFKMNNVTRNNQEYNNSVFLPRKYKILVTTDSTTKSDEIMDHLQPK
ncbi:hypothetical protein HZU73_02914 [Apis mellifera caucasica]|nr:hypothetical protein HZU73_02914 [Apis mellifera caucasica]